MAGDANGAEEAAAADQLHVQDDYEAEEAPAAGAQAEAGSSRKS